MDNNEILDCLSNQSRVWIQEICTNLGNTLSDRLKQAQTEYDKEIKQQVNHQKSIEGNDKIEIVIMMIKQRLVSLHRLHAFIDDYPLFELINQYEYKPQFEIEFDDMIQLKGEQQNEVIMNNESIEGGVESMLDKIKQYLSSPLKLNEYKNQPEPVFQQNSQHFMKNTLEYNEEDDIHGILKNEPLDYGSKRFVCKLCLRSFRGYVNYRQHLSFQHNYHSSYQCPYCEFRGSRAKQLTVHLMSAHKDQDYYDEKRKTTVNSFRCPFTNTFFMGRTLLEQHVKNRTTYMRVVSMPKNVDYS